MPKEKISLKDDIREYLPEVPEFGTIITIVQLLFHTSGLRDVGELYSVGNLGGEFTAETALRIVSRQQALNFMPGTEHDYSNTGYSHSTYQNELTNYGIAFLFSLVLFVQLEAWWKKSLTLW